MNEKMKDKKLFEKLDRIAVKIKNSWLATEKLNTLLEGKYRISYKWFVMHVYKIYPDNHEHHIYNSDIVGEQIKKIIEFIKNDIITDGE